FAGKAIKVKGFTLCGADQCAIGADEPDRETQLLRDGQSVVMPPSCRQQDLSAAEMRSPQSRQVSGGKLEMMVEQGTVNVNGDQPDGRIHCTYSKREQGLETLYTSVPETEEEVLCASSLPKP